jgi:transposase InsO family protein
VSVFVCEHRARFGVEPICRELEVSARAYRQRRLARPSRRAQSDAALLVEIRRIHSETDESYGSWRCWRQLRKDGFCVARCTVERLMRRAGLVGVQRGLTRRTTIPSPKRVAGTDLVVRRFKASRPDELWVCDFTYIRTWQGWAYLAIVLDVYSRRIVGWQLAPHMRDRLADDALQMAIASRKRPDEPLVAHTDNGSQYTSWEYTQRLRDAGIAPSRGRTGTALDNAMAESVIATIKTELTNRRPWPTRLDLELALLTWIGFYNERRIHRSLGGQTPAEITADYHHNHGTDTQKTT